MHRKTQLYWTVLKKARVGSWLKGSGWRGFRVWAIKLVQREFFGSKTNLRCQGCQGSNFSEVLCWKQCRSAVFSTPINSSEWKGNELNKRTEACPSDKAHDCLVKLSQRSAISRKSSWISFFEYNDYMGRVFNFSSKFYNKWKVNFDNEAKLFIVKSLIVTVSIFTQVTYCIIKNLQED